MSKTNAIHENRRQSGYNDLKRHDYAYSDQ